jgi:radical SAM protein with 4Fe4S-binding SPASM domain
MKEISIMPYISNDLSLYVVPSVEAGVPIYYHTVTKKWLDQTASRQDLENNLFLKGQERDSIISVFAENNKYLSLIITPTWECNLRCKHCSVLNNLKLKDDDVFPIDKLFAFIEKYIEECGTERISFDFVGGEPLLRPDICSEIIERSKKLPIPCTSSCTTNLSVDLDDACLRFFDLVDNFVVSVDGDEKQHNSQRIPLAGQLDPYAKTHANLELLLDAGYCDKIGIQAALRDEFMTAENYEAYLLKYGYMGIGLDKITYGSLHPTEHIKASYNEMEAYKQSLKKARLIMKPCCKYRATTNYQIEPSGDIYDVPFRWAKSKIGTLDDTLEDLAESRMRIIEESFVCFKDETCMSCPAIGYCWGGCVTANPLHKGKPSDYCNRDQLIEKIAVIAKSGEIAQKGSRIALEIL